MKVRKLRKTKRFQITRNYRDLETVPKMRTSVEQYYGQPHRKRNHFLRSLNIPKHVVFAGFAFEDERMSGFIMIKLDLKKQGEKAALEALRKEHSKQLATGRITMDSWPLEPKKSEQIEEAQPVVEGQE